MRTVVVCGFLKKILVFNKFQTSCIKNSIPENQKFKIIHKNEKYTYNKLIKLLFGAFI